MEWASISENHSQSNLIFVFPKRHIVGLPPPDPPRPTLCVCCCCCENEIASAVGAVASRQIQIQVLTPRPVRPNHSPPRHTNGGVAKW